MEINKKKKNKLNEIAVSHTDFTFHKKKKKQNWAILVKCLSVVELIQSAYSHNCTLLK